MSYYKPDDHPLTKKDNRIWHSGVNFPFPSEPKCRKRGLVCPGVRYLVLVLGTFYLSLVLGCVICFNPTITVMMDVGTSPLAKNDYNSSNTTNTNNNHSTFFSAPHHHDYASWSLPLADRRFPFTNMQKSLLLAGTFGACLLLIGPVGYSMQLFGAWRTQLAIGFTVSLGTGLIPLAASLNFYALLIVRMLLGLAITNLFPVVGSICTAWAPLSHRGTFLAILSGYIQLSVIISMPLTGFLCEQFGWPSVFFVHSAFGLLLTALWALLYCDDPRTHPWISEDELALIQHGKQTMMHQTSEEESAKKQKPPYRRILATVSIWAIMCAVVGNFLVIQFANTFLPMFLHSALRFSHSEIGLLSALPLLLQFLVKWLTGIVTDRMEQVSDLLKVRFCNTVAFCGAACMFLLATFFPLEMFPRWSTVLCLILCIGILGLNSGGYTKSVVLVSAEYTSTVMAGVQTMLCVTIFSGSFLVPAMTANGGHFVEYRYVFYLYAAVLFLTNLLFVLFGKASAAKWTQSGEGGNERAREVARSHRHDSILCL